MTARDFDKPENHFARAICALVKAILETKRPGEVNRLRDAPPTALGLGDCHKAIRDGAAPKLADLALIQRRTIRALEYRGAWDPRMQIGRALVAFSTVPLHDAKCRVCGCTPGRGCSPLGCHWIEPDLCSACRVCRSCKHPGSRPECPTVDKRYRACLRDEPPLPLRRRPCLEKPKRRANS